MEKMAEIQKMSDDLAKEMHLTPKKVQTFEDFLQEKHAEDYHGTDDNMPDAYETWICELEVGDIIERAQEWGNTLV